MTQVGQTISAEQFNKTYPVGTTLSADEFSNYGKKPEEGGVLPSVLGIGGSILGGIGGGLLGGIAGLPTGPGALGTGALGAIAGSSAGGALGQGLGQTIQDITGGNQFDLGRSGRQAAIGGIFGAIPGGQGMKALPLVGRLAENVVGRTALRAGTGLAAGVGAQMVQNMSNDNQQNPLGTGGMIGAINAISPVVGKAIGIVPKTATTLGKTTISSAERILERKFQPQLAVLQKLFGKEAISTGEGRAFVNPTVGKIIEKYKIPLPPEGNISEFKSSLDRASKAVEKELQPILKDPIYSVASTEPKSIILDNLGQFFGRNTAKGARIIPIKIDKIFANNIDKEGNVSLSTLKEIQREIGPVGGSDWSAPTSDATEKWARKTYSDLGQLIDDRLANVDKAQVRELMNQHRILVGARDAYRTAKTWPIDVLSRELSQDKAGGGLAQERLRQMGAGAIVGGAGIANLVPGIPDPIKNLLNVGAIGAAGYGAAQFGPHLNPELAKVIGAKLQNTPQAGENVNKLLQQLGVRLPGLQ